MNSNTTFLQPLLRRLSDLTLSGRVAVILTVAAVVSGIATYVVLTRQSTDISTAYLMLNLDLVLLLMLGTVVARQVVRLWGSRKRGVAGSRLHMRFVFVFSLLAAAPAVLMAIFSSIFLYFGVQAWFNDRVGTAVTESLEVAQAYLREHQQVMRADVLAMASDLNREASQLLDNSTGFDQFMTTQSRLRNLPEAVVIQSDGDMLAQAALSLTLSLDRVPQKFFTEADKGDVVLITGSSNDRIRALVKLDRFIDAYLYVGRVVDATVLAHVQTTERAVAEYTTLEGRQSQLQISMTLMFIAVALLLLLAAVWFGLVFSQQLVAPIGALIVAAERVRSGDLSTRVEAAGVDDEIAVLGGAFNRMTSQLQRQQEELLSANRMLEAVLSGASSGVIGLDRKGIIVLANARAEELLKGASNDSLVGSSLTTYIPDAMAADDKPIQFEYAIANGPRRTLLARVTQEDGGAGAVATIDDISALVSAQRKAAWADVARRIAHEIKNPLTPIQLSAERLKRKYLPQINDDPETFEKCTETIIRQVEDIGHMVNEFSAYARMPLPVKKMENVVTVCQDALVLQRQAHPDIGFGFIASEPDITADCDRSQLTQVITNLLQNAIDSIHERQHDRPGEGRVKVVVENKAGNISISIEDNGVGLPENMREQLLEPYVTTKKKGSGLGLAIVRKIMEDHGGSISIEDNFAEGEIKSGAKAVIVFPGNLA